VDDYNLWQDAFDTYQSLSDWVKIAWLVVPPAFVLGLLALVLHYRLAAKRTVRSPGETEADSSPRRARNMNVDAA